MKTKQFADANLLKADLAGDVGTQDFVSSVMTIWVSGIGALFVLILTGAFTLQGSLHLGVWEKVLVGFCVVDLGLTTLVLAFALTFVGGVFSVAHEYTQLAATLADEVLLQKYNADDRPAAYSSLGITASYIGAAGSIFALIVLCGLAIAVL